MSIIVDDADNMVEKEVLIEDSSGYITIIRLILWRNWASSTSLSRYRFPLYHVVEINDGWKTKIYLFFKYQCNGSLTQPPQTYLNSSLLLRYVAANIKVKGDRGNETTKRVLSCILWISWYVAWWCGVGTILAECRCLPCQEIVGCSVNFRKVWVVKGNPVFAIRDMLHGREYNRRPLHSIRKKRLYLIRGMRKPTEWRCWNANVTLTN